MAKKLEKSDVNKAFWYWWVTSHMTYNYQRLQAGSFCGMMGPVLDKVYDGSPDKDAEVKKGLIRHMQYFNTEPRWGAVIPGMTVALEEGMANNPGTVDPDTITEIKTALMGPLAGIGDTIWAGLIKPIILSVLLTYAQNGSVAAAWIWGIGVTLLDWFVTNRMFMLGYNQGMKSIDRFLEGTFVKKITTALGIIGMFALGAMIVKYVTINAVLQISLPNRDPIDLGDIMNKIIPSFLPLVITFFAYWLQKKGKSISVVLLILFVIGFAGGAIGLLG